MARGGCEDGGRPAGYAPAISVVIPAYDEEKFLPETLAAVQVAARRHAEDGLGEVEVLVVDNASVDGTSEVARLGGADVVSEPNPGIGYARNAGARVAAAPRILFLDADTIVPAEIFVAIGRALNSPDCIGGAVATDYRPQKRLLRPYLAMWRLVAKARNMTQGIAQFVTSEAFEAIGGYDVGLRMAEDTDFYWRLRRYAASKGQRLEVVTEVMVLPSCRRLDEWPIWKTLVMTNPLTTRLFLRSERFWRGWGRESVR